MASAVILPSASWMGTCSESVRVRAPAWFRASAYRLDASWRGDVLEVVAASVVVGVHGSVIFLDRSFLFELIYCRCDSLHESSECIGKVLCECVPEGLAIAELC